VLALCAVAFAVALAAAVPPVVTARAASPAAAATVAASSKTYVVAIDPGHQAKADLRTEPVGPGSRTKKPRVEGGTQGVATRNPESKINLQVALRLRDELEKRGVKVVMVRTTQKVDIANSKRAQIANAAHADLFIRLHCDGSTNSGIKGVLTLVPAKNAWTMAFVTASARAGRDIQAAVLKTTKAKDRGITKRSDLSGFNWSKVPVALVEMGVMTNRAEDRALASSGYQDKLATGLAGGVMAFLAGK
jgi:N-acetylmuramoyl-L-alanine amidase